MTAKDRAHLAALHKSLSEHFHAEAADSEAEGHDHEERAQCCKDAGDDKGHAFHTTFAKRSFERADRLTQQGDTHDDLCEQCKKATDDRLEKLVPDNISSVGLTHDPERFGIRAIPRVGGPDPKIDTSKIEIPLRHILGADQLG
jgi:hypothetical protein